MSTALDLSASERKILETIYSLEESSIKIGLWKFVSDDEISELSKITKKDVQDSLKSLRAKGALIFIDNQQIGTAGYDPKIEYLVRSRIGHIIWCLYKSRVVSRTGERDNVADIKYINYTKEIPIQDKPLSGLINDNEFKRVIDFEFVNSNSYDLLTGVIEGLSKEYSRISDFQYQTTIKILSELNSSEKKSIPKGLAVVADTGAGKSLSYQLPLLLWIICKKVKRYIDHKNSGSNVWKNCSGLLLFPRNVLAADQFETIVKLANIINKKIEENIGLDNKFKEHMKIIIHQDFGGTDLKEKKQIYLNDATDIIITNTETLKRRLYDPLAHNLFKYGLDLVLFDEIHLYEGQQGSFVAGLNARLSTIISQNHKPPFFVGMSATIDKPERHCQKLFALPEKPDLIDDRGSEKEKRTQEHHVLVKPRLGRFALGVAIDTTSCLIHNRRNGLSQYHQEGSNDKERPKSICFTNSLDITNRWANDLNDLEFFDFPQQTPVRYTRGYPTYYQPAKQDKNDLTCNLCMDGTFVRCGSCELYKEGRCWYFSADEGDLEVWERSVAGSVEYPLDNIRSKRMTSQEIGDKNIKNIYDHFRERKAIPLTNNVFQLNTKIDNLVASPVLEVGVDFKGISEVIQYGDIKSPASYKQRAGRGAREGNLNDGLLIMSVIQNSPLSNFYFRHFERLVYPQLTPIKLETRNPEIVTSQCFAAIFDFFALMKIDLFNLRDLQTNELVENRISQQYENAKKLLKEKQLVQKYLKEFLSKIRPDFQIQEIVIEKVLDLLEQLSSKIRIDDTEKSLITWMFEASREGQILQQMKEKFSKAFQEIDQIESGIQESKTQLQTKIPGFVDELRKHLNNPDAIVNKLENYVRELE